MTADRAPEKRVVRVRGVLRAILWLALQRNGYPA
ncbi:MAG: hypothetical protein QOJ83_3143 [Frankiales bacterium]|jgi:hypothetical protein|nr:hypothetical protein [Frankiales bacterium]